MKKSLSRSCVIFLCVLFFVSLLAFPSVSAASEYDSFYDFVGLTVSYDDLPIFDSEFPYFYFLYLIYDSNQMFPLYFTSDYIFGLYWNEFGVLMKGVFANTFGAPHASFFKLYDLSGLTLLNSVSTSFCYNRDVVRADPSYLTSPYYAINWDAMISTVGHASSRGFTVSAWAKYSRDSVFSSNVSDYDLTILYDMLDIDEFDWSMWRYVYYLTSFELVSRPIVAPETPVIIKDVPFVPWLEYNVGDAADTIIVSAVVADGGSLSYDWYKTTWPDGGIPVTEFYSTGQTMRPDTSSVGRFSYHCKISNSLGEYVVSTFSRSIDVRVLASGAADPPSTDPEVPSADDIGDAVGGAIEEIIESNDAAASEQGSDYVDQIIDVVPDYSEGFLTPLEALVASLGYEGTECELTVPAIVFPELPGLVSEYTLLQEQTLDIDGFFVMFPDWLLTLVQSLLTIALIVFCFKELYSTIMQFLLGRGDNL